MGQVMLDAEPLCLWQAFQKKVRSQSFSLLPLPPALVQEAVGVGAHWQGDGTVPSLSLCHLVIILLVLSNHFKCLPIADTIQVSISCAD